jgi:hypothetical protein
VTSGVFKIATHETLTPSGAYHLGVEGNAQGVKAVAPTGATYQLPGGFWMEMNVTPGATPDRDRRLQRHRSRQRTQFHCTGRHSHNRQRERQRYRLRRPPHRNRELHSLIVSSRALTNIEASVLRLEIFDCVRSEAKSPFMCLEEKCAKVP